MEETVLYKKILNVMRAVRNLEKDGGVDYVGKSGTRTKYPYVTEELTTRTVRESLIEEGLVIFPTDTFPVREGNITTVKCLYKIVDINTGQCEQLSSSGQGSDSQDKGIYKALTGAFKYVQFESFFIPRGDDPDKTSSDELDDVGKKRKINAIMEFLDHKTFIGIIEYKGKSKDLKVYKETVLHEIDGLSMQRLTTLLKHVGEMFDLAQNKREENYLQTELGDNELHKEINDLRKDI